jgi:UDP-N-acetylmuramate dehydrogenase
MPSLDDFSEILTRDEPLAPLTWLKIGGPAQYVLRPQSVEQLTAIVRTCHALQVPLHVIGAGSNLLVRDAGVSGAVVQLVHDGFHQVTIEGTRVRAGAGVSLATLISQSVKAGLAGLDVLVGIPGTVGGALKGNAGGRSGDIGQHVDLVRGLTLTGELTTRREDELTFAYRSSNLAGLIVLDAEFELHRDDPDELTRRMRTLWISKKATQPLTFQSAGCIFKNPRGMSAGLLIDRAGLKGTRIGNVEISDRHANFIISHGEASSDDVLRLIDLARSKVAEQFGVDLELEIEIW